MRITGFFLAYTVFLGLNSPAFCNRWFRTEGMAVGLVTTADAFRLAALCYAVGTTLLLFKRENNGIATRTNYEMHVFLN